MGLGDLFRPKKADRKLTTSALEAARAGKADDSAISKVVTRILDVGLDGIVPIASAKEVAANARRKENTVEGAVDRVITAHQRNGAIGGFATGLGGFVTMPIAIPANVLEFYVQATRMVGAVATLRGYDVTDKQIRTAVLLTLVGSNADEVLKKAGVATGGGRVATLATRRLPPAALLVVNKAVGFRLLRGVGSKMFSRLGRGVPVVGGLVGGGVDYMMMRKIAEQARKEFPAT